MATLSLVLPQLPGVNEDASLLQAKVALVGVPGSECPASLGILGRGAALVWEQPVSHLQPSQSGTGYRTTNHLSCPQLIASAVPPPTTTPGPSPLSVKSVAQSAGGTDEPPFH